MSFRSLKGWIAVAALLLVVACPIPLQSQPIIINEIHNTNGTGEWLELLVVRDSLDIRNWDVRDFTSTGSASAVLTFANSSLWSNLRKGTIIIVGQSDLATSEDTDASDYLLVVKANNGIHFSGSQFTIAGASDAIHIRNAADVHVFGVSWASANSGSLPSPKVHFTGQSTSNTSTVFNGNDTSQLTSTANWTQNTSASQGAGNSATNAAWIDALRLRIDGSGTARAKPDTMMHGLTYTLSVSYRKDPVHVATDVRIIIPPFFGWSKTIDDITLTHGSATMSLSGDTIYLNSITYAGDSIRVTIADVSPADSTALYKVRVQSRVQSNHDEVVPTPQIVNLGLPVSIAEVKGNDVNGVPLRLGELATITGIVTVANEFGGPSYLQDNTGGMAIFGSSFSTAVSIGDEVVVSGKLEPFSGLTELVSPYLHQIVSSGNNVTPLVVACAQIKNDGGGGIEDYEGLLVRINAAVVRTAAGNPIASWTVSGSGTNYRLRDATDTIDIRVDNNVNYANTPAPQSQFDVIGVVGQYKTNSPFIGGYQLMPRMSADILATGPIFSSQPVESNVTSSSFRISWTTVHPGTSRLRYGKSTAYELGVAAPDDALRTNHFVDITGLDPATIYHVQAFSVNAGGDTSSAGDIAVITSSPPGVTGQINVYFNKTVNTSVSSGENALQNQDLIARIVTRINNARRSIDAALYSLSAVNQGGVIANALIDAKNRGVKVRVICEYDNRNAGGSYFATLAANGIPLIDDRFDAVWGGAGLMHNKFFVFDGRSGAPESVWIWTGSWNPTLQGTTSDRQNAIEIQDASLGSAYTTEFNEMWGSSTDVPNASNSRFGARKTDNVPHNFVINGIPISLYFSPSDQTTSRIRTTIGKARHSVNVALLTFTRRDIADSVIAKKNQGKKNRVLLDNNTDTGNQFSYMQSAGVDIRLKGGSGLLHHKYALVDAEETAGTPYTITGSHNWSNSAENSNDENTLIIQSERIANLYLQEFAARYYEAGGNDSIRLTTAPIFSVSPSSIQFGSVPMGTSKEDSFFVSNPGTATLILSSVTASNANFTVSPSSATIGIGGSEKFVVTFTPPAMITINGSINILHNAAGSPSSVSLQGVGAPGGQPEISLNPTTIDFDSVLTATVKVDTFEVANVGVAPLYITSIVSSNPRFMVTPGSDTIPNGSSKSFLVHFAPLTDGPQSASLVLTHNAPGSPDTVSVTGVGYTESISTTVDLMGGWNMVSLPVKVANGSKSTVFPSAVSRPFYFTGKYIPSSNDSLEFAQGYWLKFGAMKTVEFQGIPAALESIQVRSGWNMIGMISSPIAASSIGQIPPKIIQSPFFGYDGAYSATDSLRPGRAYWVRTGQVGTLVLAADASAAESPDKMVDPVANLHLTIEGPGGVRQTLFLFEGGESESLREQFAMPPFPPEGGFDARFESGGRAEILSDQVSKTMRFPIVLQGSIFPMKISWTIASQDGKYYTLYWKSQDQGSGMRMTGTGEMIVSTPISSLDLAVTPEKPLPQTVTLDQNYPNPFNPVTTIPFSLPEPSKVTVTVYDLLGQTVRVLADGKGYPSGHHEILFDADQLPSGIYYYQLVSDVGNQASGVSRQVKKLLLLR